MDLIEKEKVDIQNFTRHPWEQTRLRIALFFIKKKNTPQFIIDFGSGDGYISSNIAQKYPNAIVIAIDKNYFGQNFTDTIHPPNLQFANSLANIYAQKHRCDFVLLMDVLEHVEEPSKILEEILAHPSITSETQFLITVPAYQWLFNRHDLNLGHYKRYNKSELIQLLTSKSFQLKKFGFCFLSLLPIRILEKIVKVNISSNQVAKWKGNHCLSRFIFLFFWLEFKVLNRLSCYNIHLPGLTCYCLCTPSQL